MFDKQTHVFITEIICGCGGCDISNLIISFNTNREMYSSDDDQDFPDDTDGDFADSCVTLDLFSDATFATPTDCLLDAKRRHGLDFGYAYMLHL